MPGTARLTIPRLIVISPLVRHLTLSMDDLGAVAKALKDAADDPGGLQIAKII